MKIKQTKGITLIALVITIIILLILAGVSIAMLSGKNGILTKASTSTEATKQANAKERLKIELMAIQTDSLSNGKTATLDDLDSNKDQLTNKNISIDNSGTPRNVTLDGYTFKVKDDLTIEGDGTTNNSGGNNSDGDNSGENSNIDILNKKDLWTNWLNIAGLDATQYNSTDILSDITIMNKVMNNENAINYMIESTEFIVPAIANSQTAIVELSKSSYLSNVLKKQEVTNILKNSKYESNFLANLTKNATMTSDETADAKTSASTVEAAGYEAYKAFDGIWQWQNAWCSLDVPQNLTYQFKNTSIVPYKFVIMGNSTTDYGKKGKAYIEASTNGDDWTSISDSFDLPVNQQVMVYPNSNINNYNYFRLNVTESTGTYLRNKALICEWEIYGK